MYTHIHCLLSGHFLTRKNIRPAERGGGGRRRKRNADCDHREDAGRHDGLTRPAAKPASFKSGSSSRHALKEGCDEQRYFMFSYEQVRFFVRRIMSDAVDALSRKEEREACRQVRSPVRDGPDVAANASLEVHGRLRSRPPHRSPRLTTC